MGHQFAPPLLAAAGLASVLVMGTCSGVTASGPTAVLRPEEPADPSVHTVPYRVHRYPAAAADPANPSHMVEIDTDEAGIHCTAHASFDGGYTWTSSPITLAPGWSICKQQGNDASETPGQPAVAFAPDGTVYAVVLPTSTPARNPGTGAFEVERSSDGGRTFSPLSFAFTGGSAPNTSNDALASYLAVDTTSGPHRGNIYVLGSNTAGFKTSASPPGPVLSVSTDGGRTFSAGSPVGVAPEASAADCCAELGISGQGEVDVVAPFRPSSGTAGDCVPSADTSFNFSTGCSALVVYRSNDAGATWSAPAPLYTQMSAAGTFSAAVDPRDGTAYAVVADPHNVNGVYNDGIYVASLPATSAAGSSTEVAHAPAGSDVAYPGAAASAGRFDFTYYLVHRGHAVIDQYDSTGKKTGTYDASQVPCTTYAGTYGNYPGFGDTCATNAFYGFTVDGRNFPLHAGQQLNGQTFDDLVGFEYGGDGDQVVLQGMALVSTPAFARAFWTDSRNNADQSDGNQDQYTRCIAFDATGCPVPAGFDPGRQPLAGLPGVRQGSPQSSAATAGLGRRVIRQDVYEPKPAFPPPLPGAPALASAPILRTVIGPDQLVPLYIAAAVAGTLAVLVLVGAGLRRIWRMLVT